MFTYIHYVRMLMRKFIIIRCALIIGSVIGNTKINIGKFYHYWYWIRSTYQQINSRSNYFLIKFFVTIKPYLKLTVR